MSDATSKALSKLERESDSESDSEQSSAMKACLDIEDKKFTRQGKLLLSTMTKLVIMEMSC